MEVESHGQGHGQFDYAGDNQQFEGADHEAYRKWEKSPCNAVGESTACGCLQRGGYHAENHAELGQARGQFYVQCDEAQIARCRQVRMHRALEQRSGDAADGHHGKQCHLEACVEETARTEGQQAQRGESDGVHHVALAVEEPAKQIESDHPERALDRRGKTSEECVGERGQYGGERGRDAGKAKAARNPKQAASHDGQVKARDHQHVKGAGALKAHAQRMGEVGAVAGDHGGEHDGVVLR